MTALPTKALGLAALVLLLATPAHGNLATQGFRAVGVAHSSFPISAVAVAPDGRLFAAVQALGQTTGSTPGQAQIRVYSTYSTTDGSTMDEGSVWATVDGVRATSLDEGLLGIALAPDFASSKLVYVYLTTTDENVNQHVRVYHENANGVGDFLGTVQTTLEPAAEQAARSGGGLAFGTDGCLYVGVGDNNSRWNSQVLRGTDPINGTETTNFCSNVCLGPTEYPTRTVTNDGALNQAGKILRLAVAGASPAQPATGAPLAAQPDVFGTGMRNPTAFAVHPLTGQLYVSERADSQQAELDVVDSGSNGGWPCLEGGVVSASGVAACLVGHTPADVYANHPTWRQPIVTHTAAPVIAGVTAYTGLGYPAEYYGDIFYLLRDSDRIYRIDLDAPCFLPNPAGVTPIAFHDTNSDNDFVAFYDVNGDLSPDNVSFQSLVTLVQGPNPQGQQVLYVVGRQGNNNAMTDDAVIFRIEFATAFTPYAGPTGHVDPSCFTTAVYSGGGTGGTVPYGYENPFLRPSCLPPGNVCPGAPDGTPCDDGDPCNGPESCMSGVCQHGAPPPDGSTACVSSIPCRSGGTCTGGVCAPGPVVADGTPCPDGNACNGLETCLAGMCQPGNGPEPLGVRSLRLQKKAGVLSLDASIRPLVPVAPNTSDALTLELGGAATQYSANLGHPDSDARWRKSRPPNLFVYQDGRGRAGGVTSIRLKAQRTGGFQMTMRGKRVKLSGPDDPAFGARVIIGDQCFSASPRCSADARSVRCR